MDSGKPLVDASFGEVLVTFEKLWWLVHYGERYLRREHREPGIMMFYKKAYVEYVPLGVIGAIVPFNYPFHNIFNPVTAALFTGNGCVVKVSEHASWSAMYFEAVIKGALQAAGAPPELVSIVTGGAPTGEALVQGDVDKVIFVGSTGVGRAVMRSAAATLKPVVLELGGKDPFIVLQDANIQELIQTAMRGFLQGAGQNCTGAERFIVHAARYEKFLEAAEQVYCQIRQGDPLGGATVDIGALALPGLQERVQELVDEALEKGARQVGPRGIFKQAEPGSGSFMVPVILADVTPDMRIWREEVFGPVMVVAKCSSEAQAVQLANQSDFGLGSSVWSRSSARARGVGSQVEAGMLAVNDFASNYMCQSLPFGGVKDSGFDRFAGVEGLHGLCVPKAVCEDRFPWLMKTRLPPPLQYPVADGAPTFVEGLCWMFFSPSIFDKLHGIRLIVRGMYYQAPGSKDGKQD